MRTLLPFLLTALALPGAALAQNRPDLPYRVFPQYLTTHEPRTRFYVGAQAGLPVYWREASRRNFSLDWGVMSAFAGLKFAPRWAVQAGINLTGFRKSYDIAPGLSGPSPLVGTGHYRGSLAAVPVQLRYSLAPKLLPDFSLEGFVGLMPQWQRFEIAEVAALPGQPATETVTQFRTTNLYATVGLTGVFSVGPGADMLVEAALNQRFYTRGDANYTAALVRTIGVGFRYRFGQQPRRDSYLAD